jgi:hypothetical protein
MFRNLTAVSLTAIAMLSMAACTTVTQGVKPDVNVASSFVKGVSTESEVDARLGKPLKSVSNPDGTRSVTYHYGEANISPLLLAGIAHGQDIITVVNFDRNGKYVSLAQETNNR